MGNAMHLRKVAMTRMRSPGNFSDPSRGQGIFQLLFAARRSIRTHDPLLPRPNQRWWRDSSGLGRAASCQCHDRQRRPQQEKISGDGAGFTLENHGFWLGSRNTNHQKKASGTKVRPATVQPNRTIACSALAANGTHCSLPRWSRLLGGI